MNKQNNTYTIIYAVGLVLVVGLALSAVYQALKPRQEENIADDTKSQILKAALITPQDGESISDLYASHITKSYIVNYDGAVVDSNPQAAFQATLNMAQEIKQPENKRKLPVFECTTESGLKYIIPVYGAGLWGPIWGYIAFNSDGSTIYGAYFAHQGETPGLGAEIEKPFFSEQFQNKHMFNHGKFESLQIVKKGKEPADKEYVHSVSGATITSHGVQEMLQKSLLPYEQFLKTLMRSSAAQ
jgi:Na+-transporting NADH:ubiquinone oxidoreductase subunit C